MDFEPEYLICLTCETPNYTFEFDHLKGKVDTILCTVCGNDEPADFITESEFEQEE